VVARIFGGSRVNAGRASADDFDVVILGGGPAGCATALALARLGAFRILVVEAGHYDAVRIGESIPPDTRVVLEQLGVWEEFLKEAHEPCLGSCSSWGDDALGYNDFLFNPLGNGWHLDRRRFDGFLARKVLQHGTALYKGTRFGGCEREGNGFRLRLGGGDKPAQVVGARFVVDATGMRSSFARYVGASRQFLDQLLCITAFFELPSDANFSKLTMLEAVEYGWWYAARLPNRRIAVAVASDPEIIKRNALRKPDGWLDHLKQTNHVAAELACCRFIDDSQMTCAAPSFVLDKVAGDGWLAVGDAASAYDPISSQGIYKALSDGARAAEAIAASLRGDDLKLGEYQSSAAPRFQQYLGNRNFFYGLERRWPASAFWMRRQARTAVPAGKQVRTN
jgi:flavin-dependent dehydrogenase